MEKQGFFYRFRNLPWFIFRPNHWSRKLLHRPTKMEYARSISREGWREMFRATWIGGKLYGPYLYVNPLRGPQPVALTPGDYAAEFKVEMDKQEAREKLGREIDEEWEKFKKESCA